MRRKDFKGAQLWIGTCWLMVSRKFCRFSGSKMAVSSRLVIKSVLEGGDG